MLPNRIPPKVVILFSVFLLLFVGVYLWQKVLSPVAVKGLVGVATADGPIYFGTLVLADEHSAVLRNVYTAAGYYSPPAEEGKPTPEPQFRVAKQGGSLGGDDTLVLSRSRVLFISNDVSGETREAIKNWTPPTPPPSPTVTPLPRPGEVPAETPSPSPTAVPTEAPTVRPVTPRSAPGE